MIEKYWALLLSSPYFIPVLVVVGLYLVGMFLGTIIRKRRKKKEPAKTTRVNHADLFKFIHENFSSFEEFHEWYVKWVYPKEEKLGKELWK